MSFLANITRTTLLSASLFSAPLLVVATPASAQSTVAADIETNAERVIALATDLVNADTIVATPLRQNLNAETSARHALIDRLIGRNQDDIDATLATAIAANVPHMDIHQAQADITVIHPSDETLNQARVADLKAYAQSKEWQRQNLAYLYLGLYYVFLADSTEGMQYAQMALDAIPGDLNTPYANDARYETFDLLHTAFVIDRNQDKGVESTERLVRYGQMMGRTIDKSSIIHNMSLLFARTQDHETAATLSELSLRLVAGQSDWDKSIAYYSHGSNLNDVRKYSEAIPFLEHAAAVFSNERFMFASKCQLALAYARTGQTVKAREFLRQALTYNKTDDGTIERMASVINETEAYINFHEGRFNEAFLKLETASDIQIGVLENLANTDRRRASKGLAVSQRVADEREARLKSEIGLSNSVKRRGYIIGLVASFLAAALGFITFNMNRQRKNQLRINAELAASRDKALVSERAKSKFLSMMGHELRTPMNPIISLADLLCARSGDTDTQHMLKMISSNGRSMLTMVENILIVSDDTGRSLQVTYQKVRIRDFLRFTCKGFRDDAEDKGLNFSVAIDKNVPELLNIDKLKLRSILANVLGNAVKFTQTGSIALSVQIVDTPHSGQTVLFSIKDSGSGINADEISRLEKNFELRSTSRTVAHDGVGVGLFIAKLFTRAHKGHLNITSHPKDGTRVDIYLPAHISSSLRQAA